MKALNVEKYSHFKERTESARKLLEGIQLQLQYDMFNGDMQEEEKKVGDSYIMVHKLWSAQLKQQVKLQWTGEGDANTTFYHDAISHRRKVNKIHMLMDDNEELVEGRDMLRDHVVEFFTDLLGKRHNCEPIDTFIF